HLPFIAGVGWTLSAEADTLAAYFLWMVTWDFLWFLLNPAYGWQRFRPGQIWWHRVWWWRFPADYWEAVGLALVLSTCGAGGAPHARLAAAFLVGSLVIAALSPAYRAWHQRMRRDGADERAKVIVPPEATDD